MPENRQQTLAKREHVWAAIDGLRAACHVGSIFAHEHAEKELPWQSRLSPPLATFRPNRHTDGERNSEALGLIGHNTQAGFINNIIVLIGFPTSRKTTECIVLTRLNSCSLLHHQSEKRNV